MMVQQSSLVWGLQGSKTRRDMNSGSGPAFDEVRHLRGQVIKRVRVLVRVFEEVNEGVQLVGQPLLVADPEVLIM